MGMEIFFFLISGSSPSLEKNGGGVEGRQMEGREEGPQNKKKKQPDPTH